MHCAAPVSFLPISLTGIAETNDAKMPKKLMILGAGQFQAPAVRNAVALGLRSIRVDNKSNSAGHSFAHEFVAGKTVEKVILGILRSEWSN